MATVLHSKIGGKAPQSPKNQSGLLDPAGYSIIELFPEFINKIPEHLPANLYSFYSQAVTAFSASKKAVSEGREEGFDAAVMMARKCVDIGTMLLDPDPKLSKLKLYKRIEALADKQILTPLLKDWAHEIRLDGNDAAHESDLTDEATAQTIIDFTEIFLTYAFTLPEKLRLKRGVDNEVE